MNVGEISFCNKVGFNINNNDVKKTILGDLESSYGIKIIARHYEKFDESRSITTLNRNPHLVCLRSNGNPYFLHLVKYNFTQYCIFVDKKIQQGYYYPRMIISRFSFDDELFEGGGTLMEGEMIKSNDGTWYFVISELLVYAGEHLTNTNLPKRINILSSALKDKHLPDSTDVCQFRIKRFFNYEEYDEIQKHISKLPYTTRGLLFKPLFMRFKDILYNFDDSLIVKVERKKVGQFVEQPPTAIPVSTPTKCAIDNKGEKAFLVQKSSIPDVYNLFDESEFVGTACISGLHVSKKMRELFANRNSVDKIEIKCIFVERFNKWAPVFL